MLLLVPVNITSTHKEQGREDQQRLSVVSVRFGLVSAPLSE